MANDSTASVLASAQTSPSERFKSLLKIIGRGKTAGKTLTESQAYDAMRLLLGGQVAPEQRGAFLMLLRVREETEAELAGFLRACREANQWRFPWFSPLHDELSPGIDNNHQNGHQNGHQNNGSQHLRPHLEIGCYAGKRRHLPWMVLALLALTQKGYRIFLHGSREPDSQRLYLDEVWRYFGWEIAQTPATALAHLAQFGLCYAPLAQINPALHELIQLRALLGLRSCANSLARMLNPAQAMHSIQGVFHRHFDEKHVQVATQVGDPSVFCFRGDGGEVEVNPERDCRVWYAQSGRCDSHVLPALLDKCQIKPAALEPASLIQIWQGEANVYGEAAVIGTMSVLLSVLHQATPNDMLESAKEIWRCREANWPTR